MNLNCRKAIKIRRMRYSAAYPTGRELGVFSWRFLEVKVKGEQWNWRFKVRGFDRMDKFIK